MVSRSTRKHVSGVGSTPVSVGLSLVQSVVSSPVFVRKRALRVVRPRVSVSRHHARFAVKTPVSVRRNPRSISSYRMARSGPFRR